MGGPDGDQQGAADRGRAPGGASNPPCAVGLRKHVEALEPCRLTEAFVERNDRTAGWRSRPHQGSGELQSVGGSQRVYAEEPQGMRADKETRLDLVPGTRESVQRVERRLLSGWR